MSHNQKSKGIGPKNDPDTLGDAQNSVDEQNSHRAGHHAIDPFAGNARDIDEQDIPEYIQTLEEHQNLCEREGRYVEAEMAKNRIIELKAQIGRKRADELRAKHMQEKLQLEEAHVAEFNQFNEFWDKKMQEFNEQAQMVEEQLIQKHQEDIKKFLEELEMSIATRPKDSAELLNLRRIQETLAKAKEYIEAHKVQQKCFQLEKEEVDKWLLQRDQKIKHQRSQFIQKQENELKALRKRIATGQEEQRKARSIELERLLQKYQNVKKELEAQQQAELAKVLKPTKGASTSGSLYKSQQGSKFGRTGESFRRNQIYEASVRKSLAKKSH